jgi:hypothetical protein
MTIMTPEKELALYLAKSGFPNKDLPLILRYCPQLIHHFSLEEITAVGLANMKMFERQRYAIPMRPFVYEAAKRECHPGSVYQYVEDSTAICANDTLELSFAELFCSLRDKLSKDDDIIVKKGV